MKDKNLKKYLPKTDNKRLAHAAEECGELIAAIGKSLRFGLDKYHPDYPEGESNREWVLREVEDVKDALQALEEHL